MQIRQKRPLYYYTRKTRKGRVINGGEIARISANFGSRISALLLSLFSPDLSLSRSGLKRFGKILVFISVQNIGLFLHLFFCLISVFI